MFVDVISVISAREMFEKVATKSKETDIIIAANYILDKILTEIK